MLDTQTKKRIDDCRDILVGKLPDPKAQIEQITIGLIYKFMDDMDKEAIELGGQAKFFSGDYEKYAWDKLFDTKVTAAEMLRLYSTAIESMEKNPNIPPLFRDIFNNAYLPYRDPETLKLFLKTIGEFAYTHSEKLGDAFEYLLSVMGSQGDAGQFRTPRHIIDFLVAIVDPDKGQSILDPACGTAGFLISAYKHILLKHTKANKEGLNIYAYNKLEKKPFNDLGGQLTPDERKKLNRHFAGYDISPDMVRLSLVNLYLHGFPDPAINEYDTLSSEERWNENYDVILANPPFMSPKGGIRPHKKFTISSNRSEVLFVDYIAEHLNPRGKAGIIVPEGIIFQSGTAYKELRKMLVDNYLYAVVSLPAGVFNPYSGVKTSILLMDKEVSKKRDEILFVKIDNDGYNLGAQRTAVKGSQLEEAIALAHAFVASGEIPDSPIAHTVLKAEIAANGDYNLSGERYKETILGKTEFDLFKLEELFEIKRGGSPRPIEDFITEDENGINWIKIGDVKEGAKYITSTKQKIKPEGLVKSRLVEPGDFILSNSMSFGRPYIVDISGAIHDGWLVFKQREQNLNKDYIFRILSSDFVKVQFAQSATGGVVKNLNIELVKKVKIPLPPISIQEEIVAEIEGYQKIIDGAKAVVANYKPKIEIDPDWEMVELGEVGKVSMCKRVFKEQTSLFGDIPFYKIGTFGREPDAFISHELFTAYRNKFSYPKKGDVLISTSGTIGRTVVFDGNPAYFQDSNIVWIANDESKVLNSFLNAYYQMIKWRPAEGVTIARLYNKIIEETKVPVPPIETQRQIVAQIEKEQALVDANKQLIEIFEQKIKDRIARVWGVADRPGASTEQAGEDVPLSMAAEPKDKYLKH
jgi:type I restriction enzyme M protein